VGRGQADDLAQKALVHLAEDVGGEHRELVGAVGVVKAAHDVLEDTVVEVQVGREVVGRLGAAGLVSKVEQARVVAFVGQAVEIAEAQVGVGPIEEGH